MYVYARFLWLNNHQFVKECLFDTLLRVLLRPMANLLHKCFLALNSERLCQSGFNFEIPMDRTGQGQSKNELAEYNIYIYKLDI